MYELYPVCVMSFFYVMPSRVDLTAAESIIMLYWELCDIMNNDCMLSWSCGIFYGGHATSFIENMSQ